MAKKRFTLPWNTVGYNQPKSNDSNNLFCNATDHHHLAMPQPISPMFHTPRRYRSLWFALVLWLAASASYAIQPDQLLPPERAFQLNIQALAPDVLEARWTIAPGYYLYRERMRFELNHPAIRLDKVDFPDGIPIVDEFFGPMEVYYHTATITLHLDRDSDARAELELIVHSQGCAEVGICYPPERRVLSVALPSLQSTEFSPPAASDILQQVLNTAPRIEPPALTIVPNPPPSPATMPPVPVPVQDGVAGLLSAQRFWALPAFFGFGLLLAFTPCVFPMIPILSSLIAGQGQSLTRHRAFALSLVYVLAMAMTYTVAGMMAAVLGQNLLLHLQKPWVIVLFSGLFILFALAMFGVLRLQMPVIWQTRLAALSQRRGGRWLGVGIMGVLSALIVGPCMAPPLLGVLTVISLSGDMLLGGSALFVMSLGMGMPLLVIGTSAGHWLPRAGAWMQVVNILFGVLLLAVAIWLLEWVLPPVISMLLWACLLIVCAVYMGALQPSAGGWSTLFRGLGLVLLVYGILLLVGVAAGGQYIWQPLRGVILSNTMPHAQPLLFQPIKTVEDLQQQLATAGERPVMLDFYADWCVYCRDMERETFTDARVRTQLQQALLLKADVTRYDADDRELLRYFNIIGPPAILFFTPSGHEQTAYRVLGFMDAATFSTHLQAVLRS